MRIEIVKYPKLLMPENPLYLAADFNKWNAGDPNFTFKRNSAGVYFLDIPNPPKRFEYKFTQGNWTMVEGDSLGNTIGNRIYDASQEPRPMLLRVELKGWEKRAMYSIILTRLPDNTPVDARLYLMGNFNNWNPADPLYELKKNIDGSYVTNIYSDLPRIEYKINRGNMASVESRANGKDLPNRVIYRNSDINHKLIYINVEGWKDLTGVFSIFSLVDLLLLFSVFQGLLIILKLPFVERANKAVNYWLIQSVGVASFMLLAHLVAEYTSASMVYPKLHLVQDFVIFLYAPLFYLYLQEYLYNKGSHTSKIYWHFAPSLLQVLVYLPFLLMNDTNFMSDYSSQALSLKILSWGAGLMGLIWNSYYWWLCHRLLRKYRFDFVKQYSYEPQNIYFNIILGFQAASLLLWWFVGVMVALDDRWLYSDPLIIERSIEGVWLMFSMVTLIIAYFVIHQPDTFKVRPQVLSIFDDVLEHQVSDTIELNPIEQLPQIPEKQLEEQKAKIDAYLLKHRSYINPKLTLNELAVKLKMPPHVLSKVINEGFGKNFFDFINTYRIEEFKRLLVDPRYQHFTFLGIAYEVGFNSKTAFNRSFKKITQQTPKEYLESLHTGATTQ